MPFYNKSSFTHHGCNVFSHQPNAHKMLICCRFFLQQELNITRKNLPDVQQVAAPSSSSWDRGRVTKCNIVAIFDLRRNLGFAANFRTSAATIVISTLVTAIDYCVNYSHEYSVNQCVDSSHLFTRQGFKLLLIIHITYLPGQFACGPHKATLRHKSISQNESFLSSLESTQGGLFICLLKKNRAVSGGGWRRLCCGGDDRDADWSD